MWARVEEAVRRGAAAGVFYPAVDVSYTNESRKLRIKACLASARTPEEARQAVLALL